MNPVKAGLDFALELYRLASYPLIVEGLADAEIVLRLSRQTVDRFAFEDMLSLRRSP